MTEARTSQGLARRPQRRTVRERCARWRGQRALTAETRTRDDALDILVCHEQEETDEQDHAGRAQVVERAHGHDLARVYPGVVT